MTSKRLNNYGKINKKKIISFTWKNNKYFGYDGDSLASALLANGVHLIARSFKYHRPRGILAAGVDDPSAKVQLIKDGYSEPNVNLTEYELVEGLELKSQNCWPSVKLDIGEINNLLNIQRTKYLLRTS